MNTTPVDQTENAPALKGIRNKYQFSIKEKIVVDQTETAPTLIDIRDKYLFNINTGANYLVLRGIDGLIVGDKNVLPN